MVVICAQVDQDIANSEPCSGLVFQELSVAKHVMGRYHII